MMFGPKNGEITVIDTCNSSFKTVVVDFPKIIVTRKEDAASRKKLCDLNFFLPASANI